MIPGARESRTASGALSFLRSLCAVGGSEATASREGAEAVRRRLQQGDWAAWKAVRAMLLRLLQKLGPGATGSRPQLDLTLHVLTVYPSLARPFLRKLPWQLEPRASHKWVSNMSALGRVYALPLAAHAVHAPGSKRAAPQRVLAE